MTNIDIHKVTKDNIEQLQEIGKTTFFETFAAENSPEDMRNYLEEEFSKEKLNKELTHPNSEFYFAHLDGRTIGYLKVNFGNSQTEIKDNNALEIERIYVLKEFHGKYVGKMLYEKAIELARKRYVEYIWLGVWEQNARAIRFYEKNGLVAFGQHIFKLGNDEQTDIMMKLDLYKTPIEKR